MKNKQRFNNREEWDAFAKKHAFDPEKKRSWQTLLEEDTKPPKSYPVMATFTVRVTRTEGDTIMPVFVYPSDFE